MTSTTSWMQAQNYLPRFCGARTQFSSGFHVSWLPLALRSTPVSPPIANWWPGDIYPSRPQVREQARIVKLVVEQAAGCSRRPVSSHICHRPGSHGGKATRRSGAWARPNCTLRTSGHETTLTCVSESPPPHVHPTWFQPCLSSICLVLAAYVLIALWRDGGMILGARPVTRLPCRR